MENAVLSDRVEWSFSNQRALLPGYSTMFYLRPGETAHQLKTRYEWKPGFSSAQLDHAERSDHSDQAGGKQTCLYENAVGRRVFFGMHRGFLTQGLILLYYWPNHTANLFHENDTTMTTRLLIHVAQGAVTVPSVALKY